MAPGKKARTPDHRIISHYKSLRDHRRQEGQSASWLWMTLARAHKRPIVELKLIIKNRNSEEP